MKKIIFISTIFCSCFSFGQVLYNPQDLYDSAGGLFDKDSLRDIYVNFQDPNYHAVLVDSFFTNPSGRIPATIIVNGLSFDSAGVRYKGNSTFCLPNDNNNPKVPYNIDMNYWVSGQKLLGYKKLKLANAWMDPTFAKEFTAAKIYRKYLPSPEVNLTTLTVQGNYLGVYVNTESINKQFLNKHFDEKSGALFKCDPSGMFCDTTGAPAGGTPDLKWINADSTEYYDDYTIKSDTSNYNEYDRRLIDDKAASWMSWVCDTAKKENNRLYLTGMGADEIFSDYGFGGVKKTQHSNFGGLFPKDLSTVFPWASFYYSSMESYLAKEEYVAGLHGLEARYPFLDRDVVQEFLWLTSDLKNSSYKSVLDNYFTENSFPFSRGEKKGF